MKKPTTKDRKKIMFYDSSVRQAKFRIRCQYDGFSQSDFFRMMLTGYIENDDLILSYVDKYKQEHSLQGKEKRRKIQSMHEAASSNENKFSLKTGEVENIFDIIESESDL